MNARDRNMRDALQMYDGGDAAMRFRILQSAQNLGTTMSDFAEIDEHYRTKRVRDRLTPPRIQSRTEAPDGD